METRMIVVIGKVQGVGFRYSAKRIADRFGITGYAANVRDYVEIYASGRKDDLDEFTEEIIKGASPTSQVDDHSIKKMPYDSSYSNFSTK
ncbi:acylphosphatase [Salinicoccus siamensis]|uniref:acylphosphatase n=1 Tax=Salinicoccus siamensis TaxID=381830 RepID=A0ABV5Z174_9STAP